MKNEIRSLRAGEPLPNGEPKRYRNGEGYIRLRWKVGPRQYVEAYEHRLVAGLDAPQVHHKNRRRDDNAPANLKPVTSAQHGEEHATWPIGEACALYQEGWSIPRLARRYGKDTALVLRSLKLRGVRMRSISEAKRMAVDGAAIARLFELGLGRRQISKQLSIGQAVVGRVLRECGLKRGPGRVKRVA